MNCQICFDTFPELYKVNCGSPVDHQICFGCEKGWREKMPIQDGKRVMSCPTCRQEETSRTVESLERELAALYVSPVQAPISPEERFQDAIQLIVNLGPVTRSYVAHRILATTRPPRVAPPRRVFCASGRDCITRSRVNTRAKTILKCRQCKEVACCASCRICTGCAPLPA
jgi:hypothetical protein